MNARRLALTTLLAAAAAWLAVPSAGAAPVLPTAPLGVYLGPGCIGAGRLPAFEQWLGRRPERASDFFSDHSWVELLKAAERSSLCWAPTGLPMSFGVPMLPRDKTGTLAGGARGDYDKYYVQIAETLVRNGMAESVIRIGWEYNHGWFTWRAAGEPQLWVAYWRRIVTAMRSVPGAKFKFDWCSGWSKGQIAPPEVYPGDDYVDIVGMDVYNGSWNPHTPQQRWQIKLNGPYGLTWQKEFAAAHGKPISFPEWGTGTRPDGHGAGDDPYYIRKMAEWIADAPVAYHNYWDFTAPDYDALLSGGGQPASEAMFLKLFGGPR